MTENMPGAWLDGFADGFRDNADPDLGVDPDDGQSCGILVWQGFPQEKQAELADLYD